MFANVPHLFASFDIVITFELMLRSVTAPGVSAVGREEAGQV